MAWSGLAYTLTYLSTIAGNILIARALGPSALGDVTYVAWLLGVIAQLTPLGIPYATQVYVGARLARGDQRAAQRLYWRGVILVSLLAVLSAIGWLVLARRLLPPQWDRGYLAISLALLLAPPLRAVMSARAAGAFRYRLIERVENASSLGWLPLALIAYLTGSPLAALGAYAARQLIPTLAWLWLERAPRPTDVQVAAEAPQEQRPFARLAAEYWIMIAVTALIWGRAEVGLLTWLTDATQVGLFAVATQLAAPVSMATSLFTAPLAMFAVRSRSQQLHRQLALHGGAILRLFSLLSGLAALGIVALTPWILGLLYGSGFRAAQAAVPWLAASGLLYATISVFSALAQGIERPLYPLAAMAASAPIFAALSWGLIPLWGARGAALAQWGSRLISLIVIWSLVQRQIPALLARRELACLAVAFAPALVGLGLVSGLGHWGVTLLTLAGALIWAWAVTRWGRLLRTEDHDLVLGVLNRLPLGARGVARTCWSWLLAPDTVPGVSAPF